MLRILAIALVWGLALAAPARAALIDIRAEAAGDRVRLLFLFDSQPEDASIAVTGAQASGTIAGVHGQGRALRPEGGLLSGISVADRPLGMAVSLTARRPIRAAEASVFENAVLFDLTLAPGPDPAPAPAPAPEPAATAEATPPQSAGETPPEAGPAPAEPAAPPPSADAQAAAPPPAETAEPPAEEVQIADAAPAPAEPPAEGAADAPEQSAAENSAQESGEGEPAEPPAAPGLALLPAAGAAPDGGPARAPLPLAPGEAADILAARLDPVSCEAAADAVASDPWALDALYDHGACLARDGQPARAREIFERLITFDPNSARALVGLGVLAQDAGQHVLARDYYERAMATGPDDGLATLVRVLRGET